MTKRRTSSLLPAVNQTEVLTRFFGATVDQVFQPGSAEPISGYIGQSPSYTDPSKDFYLREPTVARTLYQLEPAMVAQTTNSLRCLTYPDFLAYLKSSGGVISDQSRLFETDFYTWAPPIDIDKLLNSNQYFWFADDLASGSASDDLAAITLTVTSPVLVATGNGSTTSFPLPSPLAGIATAQETQAIYVDGTKAAATPSQDGNSLVLAQAPAMGAMVVTSRLDDLAAAIQGQTGFSLSGLISQAVIAYGDGYSTAFATVGATNGNDSTVLAYVNGAPVVATLDTQAQIVTLPAPPSSGTATANPDVIEVVTLNGAHSLSHDGIDRLPSGIALSPITALSSGMRVRLLDTQALFNGWDMSAWDSHSWDTPRTGTYFVDGVGQSIRLTDCLDMKRGFSAQYVTVDRSSVNLNAWSRRNHWVHQATFAWSGRQFPARKASRPIVEFIRDLSLYNYGLSRAPDIEAVLTTRAATQRDGSPISIAQIAGQALGSVRVDANVTLVEGMRLLVAQSASDTPAMNQTIYVVGTTVNNGSPVLTLTPQATPDASIVELRAPSAFGPAGTEAHLRAGVWRTAQTWDEGVDPLFMLYDVDPLPTPLDDPSRYPGSDFAGNRIFGFAQGSGPKDGVLRRALAYDQNGYISFEVDAATRRNTSNLGTITGLYSYGTDDGSGVVVSPLWHPSAQTTATAQPLDTEHPLPLNLTANPLSAKVTFISKSDWTDHFASLISNQPDLTGGVFTGNSWRDSARDLSLGTQILQHRTTLLRAMLLASDQAFDFFAAVRYGDQEYTRYRNKLARKLVDLRNRGVVLDAAPASIWIDSAISELKADKSSSFPFALSTMGGARDFIPPTPAFLGVLPPTTPATIIDTTFPRPVTMLRGHDGSLTPVFGDWRDPIMLSFEQRLFDGVDASFHGEARRTFDLAYFCNGRFWRSPLGYNFSEVAHMLAPLFERWATLNRLDYHTNTGYAQNDPFTWNFNGVADAQGTAMPGNWRAIYRYYYDTDRPHACPWEMLGFVEQPAWWTAQYGTDFSASNIQLWADLEAGCIRQGVRATASDPRYARPGLSQVLPVNAQGHLLDPMAARIITNAPSYQDAIRPWVAMDGSPAEALWRNSASFRFALAQLGYLMKPARMTDLLWDALNTGYIGAQWVDLRTHERPSPNAADLTHGETDPSTGTRQAVIGIQQWLADSLLYAGVNLDSANGFGQSCRALDVRLMHPMAGFVSSDGITAEADNFGLVPSEDMQVVLYQSPTKRAEVYSGVIVEYTGTGYRVVGYDARDPFFTCIPPNTNGPKGVITLASAAERPIAIWRPNTYYAFNTLVDYQNATFKCLKSHTSGATFEDSYWENLGASVATRAPRVVTYLLGLDTLRTRVPYGTVFANIQQVADFLLGYERYLKSRGWTFDVLDSARNAVRDWSLAARDFLEWSQVKWTPGNFIALSPGAEELHFESATGTVLNVEDAHTGFYGLVDRAGQPIGARQAQISRLGGDVTLTATGADIYGARVRVVEIEHALIFSNTTIFNDVVYAPLFNLRQARLRLLGARSQNWVGRLDAPGYMVSGDTLLPNFTKTPEDLRLAFDIERSDRKTFRDYARHQIGYQPRQYMQALLLSETEQFEFYQGMIQAKGSPGVFDRLLRSQRINADSNIVFLEEWAVRLSRFGAPVEPRITMLLPQSLLRRDPQVIRFTATAQDADDWIVATPSNGLWLDPPKSSSFFPDADPTRPLALPSAGPVRLSEVQYTSFGPDNLVAYFALAASQGLTPLINLERVWLYDVRGSFDVWRVFELDATGTDTPNAVNLVASFTEDATVVGMRLYFVRPHGLTSADIGAAVVIDNKTFSSPDLLGVQTIRAIDVANNWIEVDTYGDQGNDFTASAQIKPSVRVLRSLRFADATSLAARTLPWRDGDLVWLDNGPTLGRWQVLLRQGGQFIDWRDQPNRTDTGAIFESMIYDNGSVIGQTQMVANPPLIDDLVLIDPLLGLLPGIASREIDCRTDTDPANYNAGFDLASLDPWGAEQVGRVWWNTATVRYLDPYTDAIGLSVGRDVAEIEHRAQAWAQIAPNTSVDVYEWVASPVPPAQWTTMAATDTSGQYDGTVLNAAQPSWSERVIFDPALGTERTAYYFWVSNRHSVPAAVPSRHTAIVDVAASLTSPVAQVLPFVAAIASDTLLVSGVAQVLDDGRSALKIELRNPAAPRQAITDRWSPDHNHDEWLLLRAGDERSLPPAWLWRKLRDSLSGFDATLATLPSPALHPTRATGILAGQSMFVAANSAGPRGGLLEARRSFVDRVNGIFANASGPIMQDRLANIAALLASDTCDRYLIETATSGQVLPPDPSLYDYRVFSAYERNRLLGSPAFVAAARNGTTLRVLIDGTANAISQWSIWQLNPAKAAKLLESHPYDATDATLMAFPESVFDLATAYDFMVPDRASRDLLLSQDFYQSGYSAQSKAGAPVYTDALARDAALGSPPLHNLAVLQSRPGAPQTLTAYSQTLGWVEVGQTAPLLPDTRVYVENDDLADGFWTLWTYTPTDPNADAQGFVLNRMQRYRTADFFTGSPASFSALAINVVDWYAQNVAISGTTVSYSAANPPMVSYTDVVTRDRVEGSSPANLFVQITDAANPNQPFIWTAYDTVAGTWITVAVQGGSLQLSPTLYDPSRIATGPAGLTPAIVSGRDGSWELRVLADALRMSGVLLDAEINDLFFSMVHFVHAQQDDIDWVFKTSFLTVAGYAVPLTETAIQTADVTDSLISYVEEVKPYRVKLRDYTTQYSADSETVNGHVTDFDKPVWFDPVLGHYRVLDPTDPADLLVLQNTLPWSEWYGVHANANNPVRKIRTTLAFDRVNADSTDGFDGPSFDAIGFDGEDENALGTAADRLATFYNAVDPLTGKDLSAILAYSYGVADLMGVRFKGNAYEGARLASLVDPASDFDSVGFDTVGFDIQSLVPPIDVELSGDVLAAADVSLNAPTSDDDRNASETRSVTLPNGQVVTLPLGGVADPLGYGLRDAYAGAEHPEERVSVVTDDGLVLSVRSGALAGAPPQRSMVFDTANAAADTLDFFYGEIAQSSDAVMVWRDGVRAVLGIDYTVDHLGRSASINLRVGDSRVATVVIHAWGFGGTSVIRERHLLQATGAASYALRKFATAEQVEVVVAGAALDPSAIAMAGSVLTLTPAPAAGADLVIVVWEGGAGTACRLHTQVLPYTSTARWVIQNPDQQSYPDHAGTMVEIDGVRLLPPLTFYGPLDEVHRAVRMDCSPTANDRIAVYVDGVLYTNPVPFVQCGASTLPYGAEPVGSAPIALNAYGSLAFLGGQLVSLDPTFNAAEVCVAVYAHHEFEVSRDGTLTILRPITPSSRIVVTTFTNAAIMGFKTQTFLANQMGEYPALTPLGADYALVAFDGKLVAPETGYGWSNAAADAPYDYDLRNLWVIATGWTGLPARTEIGFRQATATPASLRMAPIADDGGYGVVPFELEPFDEPNDYVLTVPRFGKRHDVYGNIQGTAAWEMDRRWEYADENRYAQGQVVSSLHADDLTVTIALLVEQVSPKLMLSGNLAVPDLPFALPDSGSNKPGVVWIGGERIEYFQLVQTGTQVTLGNLRRGTRGTSVSQEARVITRAVADGTTSAFTLAATDSLIEVSVDGMVKGIIGGDYALSAVAGVTTVTFATPPAAGAFVVLATTTGALVPVGTHVFDGTSAIIPVPIGPTAGDTLLQPIRSLNVLN